MIDEEVARQEAAANETPRESVERLSMELEIISKGMMELLERYKLDQVSTDQ